MKSYDIAVIGLGAMGAAALYQSSKQDLRVIGIDKYSPPHTFGSSHGETRVTRQAIGEGSFYTPLVMRANEIWAELEKLSGERLFEHCGMVLAAHEKQSFLQNTLKAANEFGILHETFDGREAERRFSGLSIADKDYVFYYEPTSGFLRPERCIEVQLGFARDNGAEVTLDAEVTAIRETRNGVEITLTNGEQQIARQAIVSTGPWIKELLPDNLSHVLKTLLQTLYWFDVDPSHYDQLKVGSFPVFLCGDEKSSTSRSFYGFPMVGGPAGGLKFAVHETDKEVSPNDKDHATPVTSAKDVYAFVSRYVQGLKPNALRSANCLYTMTPDENFILDFLPGSKRIIVASACSGHGFKYSAAIGEVLCELATAGKATLDISPFRLSRFTKTSKMAPLHELDGMDAQLD